MNSFGKIPAKSLHTAPKKVHGAALRPENCTIWGKPDSSAGRPKGACENRNKQHAGPFYYDITDPPGNFLEIPNKPP